MTAKDMADAKFNELKKQYPELAGPSVATGSTFIEELTPAEAVNPNYPPEPMPQTVEELPPIQELRAWFQELLASYQRPYQGAKNNSPFSDVSYSQATGITGPMGAFGDVIASGYKGADRAIDAAGQLIGPPVDLMRQKYFAPQAQNPLLRDLGRQARKAKKEIGL